MKCERCERICKRGKVSRCGDVCGDCFALLDADNKERSKQGKKIPDSFQLIINEVDYNLGRGMRRKRWKKSRLMLL